MSHHAREDRRLDLIDELNDHPADEFLSGKMMNAWADKCLDYESEERDATIAFLKLINAAPIAIEMLQRGVHRQRSSIAMKAVKVAGPELLKQRKAGVDKLLKEYVDAAKNDSGIHRRVEIAGVGGSG